MKTVYVLELQNEGKYYVGKTNDFEKRIKQHNNINGEKCAQFVKKNGGIKKIIKPITPKDENLSNWEKDETIARMIKHGFNNVRGWEFTNTNKLNRDECQMIKKSIMGLGDRCRVCGNNGHLAKNCSSEKAKWLKELEKCSQNEKKIKTSEDVMNNLLDDFSQNEKKIKTTKDLNKNFVTEIDKSGRAKCQICQKLISKGSVRIGIPYQFKGKPATKWYHEKCYIQQNKNKLNKKAYDSGKNTQYYSYSEDYYSDTDDETDSEDYYSDTDDENCCFRCGRNGHYADECYAKKHIDGHYIRNYSR